MAYIHNFTIEEKDGVFHLLDNNEQATTPEGTPLITKSGTLANKLKQNGNATNGSFTKPSDILCYYYSTLDYALQWSEEDRQEQIDYMVSLVGGGYDPFLMFRQYCPAWPAIAALFERELPEELSALSPHRLICFIVLTTSHQSPMLAHYIISDIINGEGDYEELKADFLSDLKEYCAEKGLRFDRRKFNAIIDMFVFYYTLKEL